MELDCACVDQNISVLDPILVPWLSTDLHGLDIIDLAIVTALSDSPQCDIIVMSMSLK